MPPRSRSIRCRATSSRNCSARLTSSAKRRVRTVRASRRPDPRIGGRHRRDPCQRHGQAAADRFRHICSGTIYDIRFEIYQRKFFVKFLNNFIAQLTPFFFYLDRRLSGDPRQPLVRRAGRGAGGLQGSGLAVERTARFLSDEGGFADQIRADRRAIPAGGHDRCPACSSRSRKAWRR